MKHGFVQPQAPATQEGKPGRPAGPLYAINPYLYPLNPYAQNPQNPQKGDTEGGFEGFEDFETKNPLVREPHVYASNGMAMPTPAFTEFTASGLWCLPCGANVRFRTLTQLDGTEVYLCNTCDSEVGQKRSTAPLSGTPRPAPGAVPLASQPSSGDDAAYEEVII